MSNKLHWLEALEYLFLASAIIGLIVTGVSGKSIYAIAPLSIFVFMSWINRRRFELLGRRSTNAAIARLGKQLADQLQELASSYGSVPQAAIPVFEGIQEQLTALVKANVNPLYIELSELQQQCAGLQDSLSSVVNYLSNSSLATRVEELEQTLTQVSVGIATLADQVDASMQEQLEDLKQQLKGIQRKSGSKDGGLKAKVEHLEQALVQLSAEIAMLAQQFEQSIRKAQQVTVPPVPPPNTTPTPSASEPTVTSSTQNREKQAKHVSYNLRKEKQMPKQEQDNTPSSVPVSIAEPEVQNWQCVRTIKAHSDWVSAVAIASDGHTLVSSSFDQTVKVWNLHTGEQLHLLCEKAGQIYALALSFEGSTLASGSSDQTIKLWDVESGELIYSFWEYCGSVRAVALNPCHGGILASGNFDHTIKLWNLDTKELIDTLQGHTGAVGAIAFSPIAADYGGILASGSADGTIKVWNWQTRQLWQTLSGDLGSISDLAFTPDGQFLASASSDKTVKLWHLNTGERVATFKGHAGAVTSVIISPDGSNAISGSADGTIIIRHLGTGRQLSILRQDAPESVISLAISPDGQTLVSGTANGIIEVWQPE